jgi:hypothetical protein
MTAMNLLRAGLRELGALGVSSIALLAIGFVFLVGALKPLEARDRTLERELQSRARGTTQSEQYVRASTPSNSMEAFYQHLGSAGQIIDSLDQLHAIAQVSGVAIHTAEYRMQPTGTRIERYELRVPLRASYAQIRSFLDTALAEIPMLSLDQVKFKRQTASETAVEAELNLTLHLVTR